ncbi:Ctr copper transporter family protein [Cooperia oncophora]
MASDILDNVDAFMKELENTSVSHHHDHHSHHGSHDHSAHSSHASHGGHGGHGGHEMKMWFHGGWNEVILFDFWRIDSLLGLILSFICIFVMGAMYEGIKWFRVYLQMNASREMCKHEKSIRLEHVNHQDKTFTIQPQLHQLLHQKPIIAARAHLLLRLRALQYDSFKHHLYVFQLVLAYWLMLIVMTYNTWLTIAVILGAGFGHWLFAVLKIQDPAGETADSFATDACH